MLRVAGASLHLRYVSPSRENVTQKLGIYKLTRQTARVFVVVLKLKILSKSTNRPVAHLTSSLRGVGLGGDQNGKHKI